jgi:streptogramin lyase
MVTALASGRRWLVSVRLSLSSLPALAAAGTVTEFNVPGGVFGITAGPDGNLWFLDNGTSKIGRITTS